MAARVPKDVGWRLFLRTVVARAYPRIVGLQRQKIGMFLDVFLPLLALSAYVFVYRSIKAPDAFVGFVIIGGAMTAFWLNVLWSMSNQLYWEKETGNLALYIMAPNSMMAILLGMALGGMVSTSLRAAAILLLGSLFFGVHFTIADWRLLVLVFALGLVALYGMGMVFASVFLLLNREGWHLANLAQEPVYLLSGMYYPISGFNRWVAGLASVVPLTLALDAVRQLTLGTAAAGLLPVGVECVILAGAGGVMLVLAMTMLAYMERLAVREGRLTDSRG